MPLEGLRAQLVMLRRGLVIMGLLHGGQPVAAWDLSSCDYKNDTARVLGAEAPCAPPARCFAPAALTPVHNATLRVVNAGLGTTGTTWAHDVACSQGLPACHYSMCCHVAPAARAANAAAVAWYAKLRGARGATYAEGVALLRRVAASGVVALSDSPYAYALPELLALVPGLRVVQTLRDPDAWVARRRAKHPRETICAAAAVTAFKLESHFEVLRCLDAAGAANVTRQDREALPAYAAKMAAHEARVLRLAPDAVRACVWADNATGAEQAAGLRAVFRGVRGNPTG